MVEALADKLQEVFASLQTTVYLLDDEGRSLLPPGPALFYLPDQLPQGQIVSLNGYSFVRLNADERFILCAMQSQSVADVLLLAVAYADKVVLAEDANDDLLSVYRRLMTADLSGVEMDALTVEHHLPADLPCCTLLMHMVQVHASSAYGILNNLIPLASHDVLVPLDRHTAALVKFPEDGETMDDLMEFALAVQETLLSESALKVTVGIGELVDTVRSLSISYDQARRALDIGQAFSDNRSVHVYSAMMLERFIADIPAETAAYYHSLLFNRKTAHLFTDEMLETINMFLEKDLNLSDTARQLYIHRNTLVYRLDKVQRMIGLDIRHFNDAVTYKILYSMKKRAGSRRDPLHD